METKKRQIEQIYYLAFDGKEFNDPVKCEHYEAIQKGIRKTCENCWGTGQVKMESDFGGDGLCVKRWEEKCDKCNGKGYMELKEVWQ